MENIIIEHVMNIFAIYNNRRERKGKYKRIQRSEKFTRIVNFYTGGKTIAKYEKVIKERKEYLKKKKRR
jgi:hypothetical protein